MLKIQGYGFWDLPWPGWPSSLSEGSRKSATCSRDCGSSTCRGGPQCCWSSDAMWHAASWLAESHMTCKSQPGIPLKCPSVLSKSHTPPTRGMVVVWSAINTQQPLPWQQVFFPLLGKLHLTFGMHLRFACSAPCNKRDWFCRYSVKVKEVEEASHDVGG